MVKKLLVLLIFALAVAVLLAVGALSLTDSPGKTLEAFVIRRKAEGGAPTN